MALPVLLDHVDLGYRGIVMGVPDPTSNGGGPEALGNGVQMASRWGPGIGAIPGIKKGIDRFRTHKCCLEREVYHISAYSPIMTPLRP